ncbi:phosphotransferase [uncultured Dysosmobacter sp.]|uniref:phosphotransferase n=1 Tax=uncultured Dysosmobacter sp. TaxID=2591384 RepID=UPI00262A8352|nr:phosphotransferase [uncultured Dysosmobacter sp.]
MRTQDNTYIIVQAGGKGTRLGHLTANKPKALVPVDNLPMLFHLFRKYPRSKYIIIGDYKYEVLARYLAAFAPVEYRLVRATGHAGTCAGLSQAVQKLPDNEPFMLIWSDLILPESFTLPKEPGDYIGIAKDFPCRWKYEDGVFTEERSDSFGVAGLFVFHEKSALENVPEDGELVRWLAETGLPFQSLPLYRVKEYGLLSEFKKIESARCRPFNRTYIEDGYFVKEPIDTQGEALAAREASWYRKVHDQHFTNIPEIASYEPLKMEFINGKAIYEYENLSAERKKELLGQIVGCLKSVQGLESVPSDRESYNEAYIGKTFKRLEKVRELVPFAKDEYVTVNGRRCRNVFFCRKELERRIGTYFPDRFKLIHGDCTFSNMMLRDDCSPVLIDPRGYFGTTELYGDPAYDWAKLYYSVVGNYDQFNRKRFRLDIGETEVTLDIASNGWEEMESEFFRLLADEVSPAQIHLLHAIIWLSLTTYTWEDYDSVCGAFYNGLYYLEEAFNEEVL